MLYPQKGSMAMGSRRTTPTAPPCWAAVVSEAMVAPTNTPCCQVKDWYTKGATRARRPPKMMAAMGTPLGFSRSGEMLGHCRAGAVKRLLGWAAFSLEAGVHLF